MTWTKTYGGAKEFRTANGTGNRGYGVWQTYDGGYIIYPMGSYIVAYMNRDDVKRTPDKPNKLHRFIDALDMLANFGSYISQITVDMDSKSTKIQILKFSKNKFRFSYNGMAKKPANRPIGFKEA